MKNKPKRANESADLRQKAESRFSQTHSEEVFPLPDADTLRLVHELQVHQIELEIQNEELQRSRTEVELGLEQYTELYDFAPVGYFTLTGEGIIRKVNLHGAELIQMERAHLMGAHFAQFIRKDNQFIFNNFLEKVFTVQGKETCEVELILKNSGPAWIRIEAIAAENKQDCLAAVIDITFQKQAEGEIRRQAVYANSLASLTSQLSTAQYLDEVFSVLGKELLNILYISTCVVYMLDIQKKVLEPVYQQGISDELWGRLPFLSEQPAIGLDLPDHIFAPSDQRLFGITGLNLYSMVYQDQLVGAVAIPIPDRPRVYSVVEQALIKVFARQAAITIINLRLLEEARTHAQELENLAEVSSSLRQAQSLAEIIPLLLEQTTHILHADTVAFFITPMVQFASADPLSLPQPGPEWLAWLGEVSPVQMSKAMPAYFSANAAEIRDTELPVFNWRSTPIVSLALAKVKMIDVQIGFLCVGYLQPHIFNEDDQRLLVAITEMVGNAIHRINIVDTLEQRVQVRTRDLNVLYDIARFTSGRNDLEAIMGQSLDRVLEISHIQSGFVQLLGEDSEELELAAYRGLPESVVSALQRIPLKGSQASQVIQENQTFFSPTPPQELLLFFADGANSPVVYLEMPIRAKGEVLGVVNLIADSTQSFSPEEVSFLETIANQIGVAVETARLREDSQKTAILEERQRLARDIHDTTTQDLYSLNLLVEAYRGLVNNASREEINHWFTQIGDLSQRSLKDMRLLLYELQPNSIPYDGLVGAITRRLDAVEGHSGVKSLIKVEGDPGLLTRQEEENLYHIMHEALNNTLKHAKADWVHVLLSVRADSLKLEIIDNGIGFDPNQGRSDGIGINNMAERARRLGGNLEIESQPGSETRVIFKR